ncbi:MAG: hypothetical protein K8S54_00410, partial [Spirochaetia bacterium]|nr:hypothetical protein [Spirochaetia bacterium]
LVVPQILESSDDLQNTKYINARQRFSLKHPGVNHKHYHQLTLSILRQAYPKWCPNCKTLLMGRVSTRESVVRCLACNYHDSSTSNTPLHHLKLPLWVFSYLLEDQIHRFPQVLNAREIQERLLVSKNTASLLKRRLQVFLSDLTPAIKNKMAGELKHTDALALGPQSFAPSSPAIAMIEKPQELEQQLSTIHYANVRYIMKMLKQRGG